VSARHELRRLITNPALLIGLTGTLALFAMGVFGGLVAPYDPSANQSSLVTVLPDGRTTLAFPPTLPDPEHWFGTDPIGRDQWSRILAGAWITLSVVVAAALARLAIGFSLGLTSGWYGGPFTRAISVLATGITAVPQLLLAIMLVLVTRPFGVVGFIASLALVGWPEIGEFVRAEVVRAKTQPFIEAARSVGVPGRRLITGHLLATVGPQLLTVAALETGAVLLLLAELGLIGLFLAGATFLVDDSGSPVGPLKGRAAEWGQMLGGIQFYAITAELPTLIPALFVVVASAIFALLADGLRAASDPFSSRRVLPGTFGVLTKVLVGALCFSAVGFIGVNVRPGAMSMEDGRVVAARTAETTWPGSEFVAGVARYSSTAHGIDRPERLTYYYRNDRNEVLRISFMDADRLAVEVRKYESEDEIDFTGLKAVPSGLISYETPLARAEQTGGTDRRRILRSYIVRVILTWPKDRDAPVYAVRYDGTGGQQGIPTCCFDARTGDRVDSAFVPRAAPPWPTPAECPAARTVFRQIDRLEGYFTDGPGLSVGSFFNLNYQGDNFLYILGGQGTPLLEAAVNLEDPSARAQVVNARPTATLAGQVISFGTLRLNTPGCWKVRISVGAAVTEYTLYAYPWDCRPQNTQVAPIPSITPLPCVRR
jgi:peptide/nickel transport system permease protein